MNESVVVTGGSKGIGRAIVLRLASKGFRVISGSRTPISDVPGELKDLVVHYEMDVKNPGEHEKLVNLANSENHQIRAFVNNAGFSEWQPIENINSSFLQDILETNLMGYFWGSKAAAASMASRSPVEAPDGAAARPTIPLSSVTSASSVGLPRESRISRPMTLLMLAIISPVLLG